jgi:hypothetical protein
VDEGKRKREVGREGERDTMHRGKETPRKRGVELSVGMAYITDS